AIASKREETRGEVERRVVAQMLALMDGLKSRGKVVVIAATNVPNILDPALRRPGRFDREIEIGVPAKEGRLNILKIHTRNMPLAKNVSLKELADVTHGFVGADLSSLAKEAAMIVLRRVLPDLRLKEDEPIPKEILEKLKIGQSDFKEALKVVRPSALREVLIEIPNVKWSDIGGLEDVKQELKEAVEWPLKHPESFKRLGVRPPKGILIYGAPGTGKTLLAKAVANESEANFILVKGPELLSKWIGESEKAVREVFKKARQVSPTIIFFDEIDSLAPRRSGDSDSHVSERVVNQLLTEIDGLVDMHEVLIIGATNRPDIVDTALLRPGRFDRIILTPAPDVKGRLEIFKVHTKEMPLSVSKEEIKSIEEELKEKKFDTTSFNLSSKMAGDEAITENDLQKNKKAVKGNSVRFEDLSDKDKLIFSLAAKTEGYAGADIEAVCREAAILALREDIESKEVTSRHFDKALEKVRPSVTKEIEKAYEDLRDHFSSAKGKQLMEERPAYMG
ncbi:AAA family ATPase, partial [Candidatus Woesearchaeota archaeon]|nr:AAA family ATPase [Candidatus Woesearchaeota archaeon]